MATSARLLARVNELLQDQAATLGTSDKESAIKRTVEGLYTRYRPNRRTRLLVGTGGTTQVLPPVVTTCVREMPDADSCLTEIEYPIGNRPRSVIPFNTWRLYPPDDRMADSVLYERTLPANGQNFRLGYLSIHRPLLSAPGGTPTVARTGAAGGGIDYTYKVTALDGTGETTGSAAVTITNSPATLTGAVYHTLSWLAVPDAWTYRVYLTIATGSTHGTGILATITDVTYAMTSTGLFSFVHDGENATSASVPTTNTTETTAASQDDEAIAAGAASKLFRALASYHSGNKDPRLKGRGGWGGLADKFKARADDLEGVFYDSLGVDRASKVKPAMVSIRMSPMGEPLYDTYRGYDEEPNW